MMAGLRYSAQRANSAREFIALEVDLVSLAQDPRGQRRLHPPGDHLGGNARSDGATVGRELRAAFSRVGKRGHGAEENAGSLRRFLNRPRDRETHLVEIWERLARIPEGLGVRARGATRLALIENKRHR